MEFASANCLRAKDRPPHQGVHRDVRSRMDYGKRSTVAWWDARSAARRQRKLTNDMTVDFAGGVLIPLLLLNGGALL